MSYPSVDRLQRVLTETVFHYAKDSKKAAGRALGTLVEVITFYLLKTWGLEKYVAIERPLPEYAHGDISHNVEYSLHPAQFVANLVFDWQDLPLSCTKLLKALSQAYVVAPKGATKAHQLISTIGVLRNACTILDSESSFLVCTMTPFEDRIEVAVHELTNQPFAIVECKRVGVEEGARKGPQTIEKAKQGAYVARAVSSLQKVTLSDGQIEGVMHLDDGSLVHKPYDQFLEETIGSDNPALLRHFILTVGVVSNHGNWFTHENQNKELRVLSRAYDWLLFLTDAGLAEFVDDLLLNPRAGLEPIRDSFLASYTGDRGNNQFTKVQMNLKADTLLQEYFACNIARIQGWFDIITPSKRPIDALHDELHLLAAKRWGEIHR